MVLKTHTKMVYKKREIRFNDEMDRDINDIKLVFREKFKVVPSNTNIMNLLLKTYKETKLNIIKKPRTKKEFMIQW